MNLSDIGPVYIGTKRAELIQLANLMASKRWKAYQETQDQTDADAAEWWREQGEQAIRRMS